jgi:MFS family permease
MRIRRARLRVLAGFAALGLFWGAWGAALPAVQQRSGATDAELGVALLLVGLGALVSTRATGVVIDRVGPMVTPVTVGAFAVAGLLPGLATSATSLAICLLLLGATSGAMDVAINADGVREEVASGRPLLNLAHACFSGAVVAASLGTGLLRWAGAGPVAIFALAAIVIGLAAVAIRPGTEERTPRARPSERRPRVFEWIPGWLLLLGCLGALAYWIEAAWQNWGAVLLERTLEASPAVSALGPALFAAAMTAGRLSGQQLLARWSERRLLVVGAAVAAAGSAVAAIAPSVPIALAGVVVAGAGCSVLAPTVLSLAGGAAAPGERGTVIGSATTLMYLGFLVGPAAVGGVAQASTLRASLGAVAAVALLLGLLFATVPLPGARRGR